MSGAGEPVDEFWTNFAMAAAGIAAAVGGAAWAAGATTALLSGNPRPDGYGAPWRLLTRPGDTSAAWGHSVGPAVVFWGVFLALVLLLVVAGVAAFAVFSRGRNHGGDRRDLRTGKPQTWPGMASPREVTRAAGTKTLMARAAVLRPTMQDPRVGDVGFCLGSSHRVETWASVEDSVVVVGPPRSGKGLHLVINAILDAPGAVITTGTRPDNIAPTLRARSTTPDGTARPVMIFDPQQLAEGLPATRKWSLVRGCEDPRTAMGRAAVLVQSPGEGMESGAFWSQQCETATRCLLHAAALGNMRVIDLYEWSLSVSAARAAVEIMAAHTATAPGWTRALSTILDADPRQRDSVWAMVANTFAVLGDPRVLAEVSPAAGEEFDAAEFLTAGGTAYLLGTSSGASAAAALVAAFVDDVVETARRLAARQAGFRLDPPLALILDEAANYPLAGLPSLMSEGGGTGISTWVFLQSLAQARSRWGRDDADAIWDAAIVKVILGGGGQADDLNDLSQLLGHRKERRASVSFGTRDAGRSWSESHEDKAVLEAAHIRRIPFGFALLVLRTSTPIMLKLRRWTERRDGEALAAQRDEVFSSMRELEE